MTINGDKLEESTLKANAESPPVQLNDPVNTENAADEIILGGRKLIEENIFASTGLISI